MNGLLNRLACVVAVVAALGAIAGCGNKDQKSTATTSTSTSTSTTTSTTTTVAPTGPAATSTVVFEVTGTGQALTIDTDPKGPPGQERWYDVPLPWQRSAPVGPDDHLLQVVAIGKDDAQPGCRITLDGKVVAEQPAGGTAHCTYQRP